MNSAFCAPRKTTLKRIRVPDVKRQYQAVIQPEGATIVVVGAIDAASLKGALDGALGDWKGKPTAKSADVAKPTLPTKAIYLADFPGSTQSALSLARRAAGHEAPDYFAARVFNWALGGAFTSRLNLNLHLHRRTVQKSAPRELAHGGSAIAGEEAGPKLAQDDCVDVHPTRELDVRRNRLMPLAQCRVSGSVEHAEQVATPNRTDRFGALLSGRH